MFTRVLSSDLETEGNLTWIFTIISRLSGFTTSGSIWVFYKNVHKNAESVKCLAVIVYMNQLRVTNIAGLLACFLKISISNRKGLFAQENLTGLTPEAQSVLLCTYAPYPSLIRALRACASLHIRALLIINMRFTRLTRLYPHQLATYVSLPCLVTSTFVSVSPRAKKVNVVRNDHGHTQRCEFSV